MKNADLQPFKKKIRLMLQGLLLALSALLLGCATTSTAPSSKVDGATPDPAAIQKAINSGDEALRANNMERALFHYVKALSLDPTLTEVLYKIATIHSAMGNTKLAEKAYRDTLKQKKNHTGALEGLGLLQLHNKEYNLAEKNLKAAIKADAKRWRAHNGLGVIADLDKDYSTAQKHYAAALKIKSNSPLILNNLGYSHYLAGEWPSALYFFEKTLAKDSHNKKAWANLGLIYVRQGDYEEAVNSFGHIMDEAEAFYHIGYILMMEGEYHTAITYFRKAISASPTYYAEANENLKKTQVLLRRNR